MRPWNQTESSSEELSIELKETATHKERKEPEAESWDNRRKVCSCNEQDLVQLT